MFDYVINKYLNSSDNNNKHLAKSNQFVKRTECGIKLTSTEHPRMQQNIRRKMNKERPTSCHLLHYFIIYCSTCFGC